MRKTYRPIKTASIPVSPKLFYCLQRHSSFGRFLCSLKWEWLQVTKLNIFSNGIEWHNNNFHPEYDRFFKKYLPLVYISITNFTSRPTIKPIEMNFAFSGTTYNVQWARRASWGAPDSPPSQSLQKLPEKFVILNTAVICDSYTTFIINVVY